MTSFSTFGIKVLLLLISIIFNLAELFVLLRFLLQLVKADFRNPFCQFLMKITSPLLHPLRRIIPGAYGIDIAALVLFYLLIWAEGSLISLLNFQYWSAFSFISALLDGIHFYLNLTFFLIILGAIIGWIPQAKFHPTGILIHLLTDPYLKVIRRIVPTLGGFDFSPLIALVIIQILNLGLASL